MPISSRPRRRREKLFGTPRGIPLDRNAKARICAYARGWSARHRQPGQHRGPLTRATLEVLEALLWGFHNSHTGICFPGYDTIATKARCHRDTVSEAIKVLESAGVLTWDHRLRRIDHHQLDLLGQRVGRTRIVRTSNAYRFIDHQTRPTPPISSKSENPPVTLNQAFPSLSSLHQPPKTDPDSALERALARLKGAVSAR